MHWWIRLAEKSEGLDVAHFNEIVQELHWRERPDWFKRPNGAAFLPTIEAWFESDDVRVLVADNGQALLGYAVAARHERPPTALKHGAVFVELDQIVVAPVARRLGVGRALCSSVVEWATEVDASRVELGTWAFNDSAYELFESVGFQPTVRRMSLSLNEGDGRSPQDPGPGGSH